MVAMTCDPVEYRGCEDMKIKRDEGGELLMTCFRFDDDNGVQTQFYVTDPRELENMNMLVRGGLYNLKLNIGKGNKAKLLGVSEV